MIAFIAMVTLIFPSTSIGNDLDVQDYGFGTLNVILANQNGFVIAADSKITFNRTSKDAIFSQKLFRLSQNGAMVVAGFYSSGMEPFRYEVPGILVGRFGKTGLNDGRGAVSMAAGWLSEVIGVRLTALAGIYATYLGHYSGLTPEKFSFVATFAELNEDRVPEIRRLQFIPSIEAIGSKGNRFPLFDRPTETRIISAHFEGITVGITAVANAILNGDYETRRDEIQAYYKKKHAQTLDGMTIDEMKRLVYAIFDETGKHYNSSQYVGGPVQIGVFHRDGKVEWLQQQWPEYRPAITKARLTIGSKVGGQRENIGYVREVWAPSSPTTITAEPGKSANFTPVPDQLIFLDTAFDTVQLAIEKNTLIGSKFYNCLLTYTESGALLSAQNECINTMVQKIGERPVKLSKDCSNLPSVHR